MQEYVEKYLEICSALCKNPDDYTKANVKRHNEAMVELQSFVEELVKDREKAEKVFAELMDNEDIAVQASVCGNCLKYDILTEKAEKRLKKISRSKNYHSFGAEMTLKVWRGEIPGKTL